MPSLHSVFLAAAAGISLVPAAVASREAAGDPLAGRLWVSRVLVVLAPTSHDLRLAAQRRTFARTGAGTRERDLVLVEGVGSGREAAALRDRFSVPEGEFRAILVGKDGGAKLVEAEPIEAERLFQTIDAMPMRQDEMRRSGGTRS